MSRTRVHFGVLAGVCASLGSLFGKLMSQTEKINYSNAGNIYFVQVSVYKMEFDISCCCYKFC